jgi:hypothetical protein
MNPQKTESPFGTSIAYLHDTPAKRHQGKHSAQHLIEFPVIHTTARVSHELSCITQSRVTEIFDFRIQTPN